MLNKRTRHITALSLALIYIFGLGFHTLPSIAQSTGLAGEVAITKECPNKQKDAKDDAIAPRNDTHTGANSGAIVIPCPSAQFHITSQTHLTSPLSVSTNYPLANQSADPQPFIGKDPFPPSA